MQTRNPILDELAKMSTSAMGLAQAAGDEAKAAFRAQTDRVAAEMDLVRRDEFDILKAQITALRAEVAELQKAAVARSKAPDTGTSTDGTHLPDAAG